MSRLLFCSACVLAAALVAQPAKSDPVFAFGSTMPVSGTNAPNTFSTNVPLTLGTTTIDNGALNLTASLTN
jgi:hypothetical protein